MIRLVTIVMQQRSPQSFYRSGKTSLLTRHLGETSHVAPNLLELRPGSSVLRHVWDLGERWVFKLSFRVHIRWGGFGAFQVQGNLKGFWDFGRRT